VKKTIIFIIIFVLLISIFPLDVLAKGDGNFDGGGGDVGSGTSQNFWSSGNDGVRVTVIKNYDNTPVTTPIDITNRNQDSTQVHFGKKSKITYVSGSSIIPYTSVYRYYNPTNPIPRIISTDGNVNIDAIKSYFCSEYAVKLIADITEINFETLINGEYKILLEPIAYMTFQGVKMGMTAHEAALYDEQLSGGLRSEMGSLSHKNLPFAMFLEKSDLGFPIWSGSTNQNVTNAQIKSSLGLGIVSFREIEEVPEISSHDYEYRCDTDVITAVTVTTGRRRTPDNPITVEFRVNGRTYTVNNIYIPEGESQLVWFKWRTPITPQTVKIDVSVSGASLSKSTITANIVDLNEKVPPNPIANDRNEGFKIPAIPNKPQKTTATWGEWDCYWEPKWEWESDWDWYDDGEGGGYWEDNGSWVDNGDWKYEWISYSASLSSTIKIKPDNKVPTASSSTMKSGYGINMDVSTNFNSNAPSSHITGAQNVLSYYPEFHYQDYLRLLERTTGGYSAKFQLKSNKYSTYNQRVHFTPVWFPDGKYTVYAEVIDAWTPDGMLSINLTDEITIKGSLYDDWHVGPKK
jgi:hypothetical protein